MARHVPPGPCQGGLNVVSFQLWGTSPENSVSLYRRNRSCRTWLGENWTSSATRQASSSQRLAFIRRKACHRSFIDHGGSLSDGNSNGAPTPPANNVPRNCANSSTAGFCTRNDPKIFCIDVFEIFPIRYLGQTVVDLLSFPKTYIFSRWRLRISKFGNRLAPGSSVVRRLSLNDDKPGLCWN